MDEGSFTPITQMAYRSADLLIRPPPRSAWWLLLLPMLFFPPARDRLRIGAIAGAWHANFIRPFHMQLSALVCLFESRQSQLWLEPPPGRTGQTL